MKKWILGIVITILALAALAGAGFAGYRIGFVQGARVTQAVRTPNNNVVPPFANRSNRYNQNNMPQFHPWTNDRNFGPGFAPNRFPVMRMGRGFGFFFFPPLQFLWHILLLGLVIWFLYWLFTKSGWQITRTNQSTDKAPAVEANTPSKKKNAKSDG